jgi:translocation and assembly module TamB
VIDTSVANNSKLVPAQSPLMQNLRIAVRLAVNHDTWVRSADANVEIYTPTELNITIDRARQAMVLDGTVNTERGTYSFSGRRFTLSRGSATFVGDPEINPILQLIAEHQVQLAGREALQIRIIIGGTMRSPRITLESDAQPPISQSDLFSYLAFGQSTNSLLQSEGSSGLSGTGTASGQLVGQAAGMATRQLAAVAIGALTTQFQQNAARELGTDELTVSPADVPSELSLSSAQSLLLGTQVEAGKYIGRRTYLAVQARPTFVAPGVSVEQRWAKGYRLQTSIGPRVILQEPSLATVQQQRTKQVFGSFLIREWRF